MFRLRFVAPLLVIGVLFSGLLMGDDKKTDKEPIVVTNVRLPPYYSKLGLSQKQRSDVLKIRAKYAVEIQKLKDREKADMENVLTSAQKTFLRELNGGVKEKDDVKEKGDDAKEKASAKDKNKEIDKPVEGKKK